MKSMLKLAAAAAAIAAVAACGQERGSDGLTAEEREKLNSHSANLDSGVVDASPDSLVANDEWMQAEAGEAAAENGAAAAESPDTNGQ